MKLYPMSIAFFVCLVLSLGCKPESDGNNPENPQIRKEPTRIEVGGISLENPLCFSDGSTVASELEWSWRREEILAIFQKEIYGQMPKALPIYWEKV